MKRVIHLLATTLLAAGLATAAEAKPRRSSIARRGARRTSIRRSTRPALASTPPRPVYNQLVEFERGTTTVVPALPRTGTFRRTATTITFHLRKGVKFHSEQGFTPTRDFNADDVLFSFNRQWKQDNPYHKVSGGAYDYFNDMGMPDLLEVDRQGRRLHGEVHAERAERADPRQPRHGFRHHPVGRICRLR